MFLKKSIVIIIVLLIHFSALFSQTITNILPDANSIEGLKLVEKPKLFSINELNNERLADVINEYGFEQLLVAKYAKNEKPIEVKIFEMRRDESAYGLFTFQACAIGNDFAHGNPGIIYNDSIIFRKGKYFVSIKDLNETNSLADDIKMIAEKIALKILNSGALPELAVPFFSSGLEISDIDYIKGPISLSSVYFFHYKEIFGFNECVSGNFGDYYILLMSFNNEMECEQGMETSKPVITRRAKFSNLQEYDNGYSVEDKEKTILRFLKTEKYMICYIGPNKENIESLLEDFVAKLDEIY